MQSTHGRAAGELYGIQFSLEAVSEAEVYHLIALHSDHNLVGCAVLRDFLPAYTLTGEEKYKHIPYEHKSAFKQCRKVKCGNRVQREKDVKKKHQTQQMLKIQLHIIFHWFH